MVEMYLVLGATTSGCVASYLLLLLLKGIPWGSLIRRKFGSLVPFVCLWMQPPPQKQTLQGFYVFFYYTQRDQPPISCSYPHSLALDGGHRCRLSILRNHNVTLHYLCNFHDNFKYIYPCRMSNLRNTVRCVVYVFLYDYRL